jgi:hypothetical protein
MTVMPANAGIHALLAPRQDVDGRDIGEQSDAVLRTAMPGHDGQRHPWRSLSATITSISASVTMFEVMSGQSMSATP